MSGLLGSIETGEEAAAVIEWLHDCGLGYQAIACILGVSPRTLADVRIRQTTPHPATRVRLWRLYLLMEEAEEQQLRRKAQCRRRVATAANGRDSRFVGALPAPQR